MRSSIGSQSSRVTSTQYSALLASHAQFCHPQISLFRNFRVLVKLAELRRPYEIDIVGVPKQELHSVDFISVKLSVVSTLPTVT